MKKSIMTIVLIVGLTNNLQAGSLLKPMLKLLVKGTDKIISRITFDDINENNQTRKENK